MITELTKEQEEKMAEYRDKWIKIGLSTEPANRELAEEGVNEAYAVLKLPAPKIIWCESPLQMALTRALTLESAKKDPNNVNFSPKISENIDEKILNDAKDSVSKSCYGQHDASWLAFYEYFKEVCGLVEETKVLSGLWKIAKNAGWWIPHEKVCWISERHNFIKIDEKGKLHNYDGPALTYPDGWAIYSFHGVRVPEKYLGNVDAKEVLAEKNAEIRMAVMKKIGIQNLFNQLPHKIIDKKDDYELLGIDLGTGRYCEFLKMVNPTTKETHVEGVEPGIETVTQALAWRAGLASYSNPIVRT